jgi:hypothetical protein
MYQGYSPAEARSITRQIDRAARNVKITEYQEYAAESRACGCEPESLAEWLGEVPTGKAAASKRLSRIPSDELDLY